MLPPWTGLNLLFAEPADTASHSGAGMATLAELDGMRCPAARGAQGSSDDIDADDDLAAMLARVRVSPGAQRGSSRYSRA
jgi:hypothetical protein